MDNVNIDLIIERTMRAFGVNNQEQLSDIFNISPQDFSGRKRRGSILKLIEKEAFRRGISYDWIKTGVGSMIIEQAGSTAVAEPQAPYTGTAPPGIGSLIDQTIEVLKSDTKYARALKENIEAFHQAVSERKKITDPPDAATEDRSGAAVKKAAR
jgi:hypothetical protein